MTGEGFSLVSKVNSLVPGRFGSDLKVVIFKLISRIDHLGHVLPNCPQVDFTSAHWWSVNIVSGNDQSLWHHMASLSYNILEYISKNCMTASWKRLPHYWPFMKGIHCWHIRERLVMHSFLPWASSWTNSLVADDLRRNGAHVTSLDGYAHLAWGHLVVLTIYEAAVSKPNNELMFV